MDAFDINEFMMRLLLFFPMFLFSLTIHEVAHALTANWGGDLTSTYEDRLSLNPVVHIDPVGTVLIPILNMIYATPLIGWAKPVPVREARFLDMRWNVVVAMAGPFSNFLLALFATLTFSLVVRCLETAAGWGWGFPNEHTFAAISEAFYMFIFLNLGLMAFNLTPIPPLDGSHLVYHFVIRGRGHLYAMWDRLYQYGFLILMFAFWALGLGRVLWAVVFFIQQTLFAVLGVPGY